MGVWVLFLSYGVTRSSWSESAIVRGMTKTMKTVGLEDQWPVTKILFSTDIGRVENVKCHKTTGSSLESSFYSTVFCHLKFRLFFWLAIPDLLFFFSHDSLYNNKSVSWQWDKKRENHRMSFQIRRQLFKYSFQKLYMKKRHNSVSRNMSSDKGVFFFYQRNNLMDHLDLWYPSHFSHKQLRNLIHRTTENLDRFIWCFFCLNDNNKW